MFPVKVQSFWQLSRFTDSKSLISIAHSLLFRLIPSSAHGKPITRKQGKTNCTGAALYNSGATSTGIHNGCKSPFRHSQYCSIKARSLENVL